MSNTETYNNYLRYGSKRMPKVRGVQEIDMTQGLILGYRGRESSVPPGYCTRLQNVVPRNDRSYAVRPPFYVGDALDPSAGHSGATIRTDFVVGTFPDGSILSLNKLLDPGDAVLVTRTGFASNNFTAPSTDLIQAGNAAHWGNQSVIPYVLYGNGDPNDLRLHALAVTYNSDLTLTVEPTDLHDLFGHEAYAYQDQDTVDSAYARSFALTWKGRSFILAGSGISYSAPLQPGVFETASGGGFIPLDTHAPITGAFILQDVMYICTEAELFMLTYEIDPGRDRSLQIHSRIECRGALEHDNVGYIATANGLYRIVGNALEPTFVPSDQNYYNAKVTGDTDGSVYPLDTDSVYVPRICGLHRFGDLIVLAGLGFNADRRHGTPTGDVYRYPAFSTSTETWVEWTGPGWLDGGIFSPVNALPVYQGSVSSDYSFPMSHVLQMFEMNHPTPSDRPGQAFINIGATNQTIELVRDTTVDSENPITVDMVPFIDVNLKILFPTTLAETFAVSVEDSAPFEIFILTGRVTFGSPLTWKRIHRYWLDANLYGAGALADNSFMYWNFYTPYKEDEDFSETVHERFDEWLEATASMRNQTPGHLVALMDEPQAMSRFTSAQIGLYWRSPLELETPPPENANPYFETDASGWSVTDGSIVQSAAQAHEGTNSGLVTAMSESVVQVTTDAVIAVTPGDPYRTSVWVYVPGAEVRGLIRHSWLNAGAQVLETVSDETLIPADSWTNLELVGPAAQTSNELLSTLEVAHPIPGIRAVSTAVDPAITVFEEDFEAGISPWEGHNASITSSSSTPHSGSKSLQAAPGGAGVLSRINRKFTELIPVNAEELHRLSMWVYRVGGTKKARLRVYFHKSSGFQIGNETSNDFSFITGSWKQLEFFFTTPPETEFIDPTFEIFDNATSSDRFRIDDVTVQRIPSGADTIDKPAGTQEGDLLVMIANQFTSISEPPPAPGDGPWTHFDPQSNGNGFSFIAPNHGVTIFTKTAGASEPASYPMNWPSDTNLGSRAVSLLAIKSPPVDDLLWSLREHSISEYFQGAITPGLTADRAFLEVRYAGTLSDTPGELDSVIVSAPFDEIVVNQTPFEWGHVIVARQYDGAASSDEFQIQMDTPQDNQRLGITLGFLIELTEPAPFHIDEATVGPAPGVVEFDPNTPKWAETGVGKIYVDVTEYKPSTTGI